MGTKRELVTRPLKAAKVGGGVGDRTDDRIPASWQATVGGMRAVGARVYIACLGRDCETSTPVDPAAIAARFGDEFSLWDRRPICEACGRLGHYMASPAEGTPYRPLRTGIGADARRELYLRSFSFSTRDIARIKFLAERVTPTWDPPPLRDLDVPYTVGAVWPGRELRSTGRFLGHWANRTLLVWEMNLAEREVWAARPKGPRPV